jgi:hypothetical protein
MLAIPQLRGLNARDPREQSDVEAADHDVIQEILMEESKS